MALCYPHSPYLFYMELLFCYHLHASLTPPLIVTNFCSYVQNQYSHVSILPLLYSGVISNSFLFTAPLLLLWHTFLKCPILPHPAHVFLYAGHCLGRCTPPQYQHGCCCNVWPTRALVVSSFALWIILFCQIAAILLVYLTLLPAPIVPPLFLPKPIHPPCDMIINDSYCQLFYKFPLTCSCH